MKGGGKWRGMQGYAAMSDVTETTVNEVHTSLASTHIEHAPLLSKYWHISPFIRHLRDLVISSTITGF